MNKKLLAAAVAAALVAPMAASAESTIYGNLHTSIVANDTKNKAGQKIVDNWDVESNDGQLGIKGSEDLGGGLKALYKIEVDVFPSGGELSTQQKGPTAEIDEIWIGLTGGWGTALIGREDTPYKTFLDSPGVDILGDSIVDIDTNLRGVGEKGFERFTANGAIAYVSPNFSGFTFGAAVIPGGQTPASPGGPTNSTGNSIKDGFADHYSIAGNFISGGLKVAVGYEKKVPLDLPGVVSSPADDQKNAGIAASYTFNQFFVGLKYEDEKNTFFEKDEDTKRWAATGKWSFGNNAIGLVYSAAEREKGSTKLSDTRGYGIFGEHNFSNRTKVYVAYNDAKDKQAPDGLGQTDAEKDKTFAAGVIHSF